MRIQDSEIKNICVFCGSSSGRDDRYAQMARAVGTFCAESGRRVVYGGGRVGLMGEVANAALEKGGEVIGIIPRHLQEREVAHLGLTQLEITGSMHERQKRMTDLSDAFIVLPGGLGTLAEFFEVVTWKQLGLHAKPIILLNHLEYWDFLIKAVGHSSAEGFLYQQDQSRFTIAADIGQLRQILGPR